jgi:predicted cation transporter
MQGEYWTGRSPQQGTFALGFGTALIAVGEPTN